MSGRIAKAFAVLALGLFAACTAQIDDGSASGGAGGATSDGAPGGSGGTHAGGSGGSGGVSASGGSDAASGGGSDGGGADATPLPACGCYYGDGLYCGQGVVDYGGQNGCAESFAEAHAGDVLRCAGGAWSVETACSNGCVVAPKGTADYCKADSNGYLLPWSCGVAIYTTQGNNGDICSSNGGDHTGKQAYAWDFGLSRHSEVRASRGGTVTVAANVTGPGQACYDGCTEPFGTQAFWDCCNSCLNTSNHVNVDHGDGTVATYWHLDIATVTVGQQVKQGDVIGYSGTSGCSSGPHLHFMVMGNCPTGYCQSIAISFADGGNPACGDTVTSQNGC